MSADIARVLRDVGQTACCLLQCVEVSPAVVAVGNATITAWPDSGSVMFIGSLSFKEEVSSGNKHCIAW